MEDKYILLSLEDSRSKKLAEVLANKTCKKIIDLLAEKELSEKDISDKLNVPINTIEYNLKKLLESGLVEKTKNFFWSKKGKKIPTYKLSNKSIIISPKKISSKLKSILPVAFFSVVGTIFVKYYFSKSKVFNDLSSTPSSVLRSEEVVAAVGKSNLISDPTTWLWFLLGALSTLLIFTILNWRKL